MKGMAGNKRTYLGPILGHLQLPLTYPCLPHQGQMQGHPLTLQEPVAVGHSHHPVAKKKMNYHPKKNKNIITKQSL